MLLSELDKKGAIRDVCGSNGVEITIDECTYYFRSLENLKDLIECNADEARRSV